MRLVRQIITVGNSVGITLPREFLDAYGLGKGALMEVRATGMGLLLRPLRVAPRRGRCGGPSGGTAGHLSGDRGGTDGRTESPSCSIFELGPIPTTAWRMTTMPKKGTVRKAARKTARRTSSAARGGIPFRTVTPYLAVSDAAAAIDWYKRAFGAKELTRMPGPGGKIMHAEVMIGDSRVMLSDVFRGGDTGAPQTLGGTTSSMHIYHRNVDKLWRQAVAAGASVTMPLEDQFWGDRYGKLKDPSGTTGGCRSKPR